MASSQASAEPEKKTPYSDDLRWRVVWLRLAREQFTTFGKGFHYVVI